MHRHLLLSLCCCAGIACSHAPSKPRSAKGASVKVMTYNVNYGLAGDPATLAAIGRDRADVVFLQETTPTWEVLIRQRFSRQYPHIAFKHTEGGAGGLAVLSKYPFRSAGLYPPPRRAGGWFPAWRIILRSPLGKLQALQVHLRPPVSDGGSVVSGYFSTRAVRRTEIARYARHLDERLPTLVVGDFNESNGRAIAYLQRRGLRSVLGQYRPKADTWRWQTSVGKISHKLDHILYDGKLQPLNAWVVHAGRSDHLPLIAVFQRHSG